ncbi:MAG: UDP-3-O-(3-hydroxymyristoyl)glucosamine N-acyltransferase [Phycisphaerae bacterium]|nr:UDP-3-O-(3-hydroxymyristoyl)glucosamine N-acyltransferase [Phycisphaerae bacterium]
MVKLPLTVEQIAKIVGGQVKGDGTARIEALATIEAAGPGELTFAVDEKRARRVSKSKAGAVIVGALPQAAPMPLIRVENVQAAVAALLGALAEPEDLPPPGTDETAAVDNSAQIAPDVAIGPGAVVGRGARIGTGTVLCAKVVIGTGVELGENSLLHEGVVVKGGCKIGNRVRIGPNSVIGTDGFGYYFQDGVHHKIPHIGTVIIEDDVEIGACSCVDRAKFGATRIGPGCKIDNLVQIAHNVQLGKGSVLAALTGVAGSTKLGQYVVLGGHVGIRDNITLGNGVNVGACTCVAGNVADGQTVFGIPAGPARAQLRIHQAMYKLPDLLKRVKSLEAKVGDLESTEDH